MSDRDFNGTLHSAERLYLDKLWQGLGVNPLDERVQEIEARLVRATLASISESFRDIHRDFERRQAQKLIPTVG